LCIPDDIPLGCLDKSRVDKNRIIEYTKIENNYSIKSILADDEIVRVRGLDILEDFVDYWGETDKN